VIGRVFRLVRAFLPQLAHPDDDWARKILSTAEFGVFFRMDVRDREHAIRVTRKLLKLYPNSSLILQRAALLHDCGKLVRPYNVVERVLVGLFYQVDSSALETRATDFSKPSLVVLSATQVKKYHPRIGSRLILEAGGNVRVAQIVAKHHAPGDDLDARRIHEVDELE
jgi:HD domain